MPRSWCQDGNTSSGLTASAGQRNLNPMFLQSNPNDNNLGAPGRSRTGTAIFNWGSQTRASLVQTTEPFAVPILTGGM
eukprot:9785493-Alexandrium_andersonii.AAC.1